MQVGRAQFGPDAAERVLTEVWEVHNHDGDTLQITIGEVFHDSDHDLGIDPGLQKDGVEAHLQVLLAANPAAFGDGWTLVQREYLTPIGPVDLLFRDHTGGYVAVEVKRRGEIDGVEQLTRYLELMNRDPHLAPVTGVFAAQEIKPQARMLAQDRGIRCLLLDYDAMRGLDIDALTRDAMRGVDVLIADSSYTAQEYPAKRGWGHGSFDSSIDYARRAGAKVLFCTHHEPTRSDDALEAAFAQAVAGRPAGESAPDIRLAREGDTFEF